jgi:hypothetical protein
MIKLDSGNVDVEWQALSVRATLLKIECNNYHVRFSITFYEWRAQHLPGHEMYMFLNRFSGHNKIRMADKDHEKTTFVTKWGIFMVIVMMFVLKMATTTF